MAVKPWPQITTTLEAAEYINAELAEAQKYCPASAEAYATAAAYAAGGAAMDWSEMKPSVEQALQAARAVWHENNCTKAGATPPAAPSSDAGWFDQMMSAGGGGGGAVPSAIGGSKWIWIGVAVAAAAFLFWGGKKAKKRYGAWRKTRTVGYVRANPCHRRRRR